MTKVGIVVLAGAIYMGWRVNEEKANLFPNSTPPPSSAPKPPAKKNPPPTMDGKPIPPKLDHLVEIDTKVGTGKPAKKGDAAWVDYTGMLTDGTQFDSSLDRHEPFKVAPLGTAGVIAGWNQGVVGMKVGGKRRLIIPSKLGYGEAGQPPTIPPDAVLVFDIELRSIGNPPAPDLSHLPPGVPPPPGAPRPGARAGQNPPVAPPMPGAPPPPGAPPVGNTAAPAPK